MYSTGISFSDKGLASCLILLSICLGLESYFHIILCVFFFILFQSSKFGFALVYYGNISLKRIIIILIIIIMIIRNECTAVVLASQIKV